MRGASRPAACGRRADQRRDVRRDGAGVGHPEDGAVGDCTGHAQQSLSERGDEDRHGHAFGGGGSAEANVEILAVELDGFAVQQLGEDRHVLHGVAPGIRVRHPERTFDHRLVRRSDTECEPVAPHRSDHRQHSVRHQRRVRRIRLQHRGAQLQGLGRAPGERDGNQRVTEDRTRIPQRAEALGFRLYRLVHDPVDGGRAAIQSDLHRLILRTRPMTRTGVGLMGGGATRSAR